MEQLINHTYVCSLVYSGNIEGALISFKETFDHLKSLTNNLSHCKLLVQSLNLSIYNYILIKENISLHRCCIDNHKKILASLDFNALRSTGLNILSQYSTCQEYLFEKFSHPGIKNAVQYIHQHMHEPLTLETICQVVNMNKCYFCTLFKQETNYTFTQYLNYIRLTMAKRLIQSSEFSLHEIAFRCGFNSYPYFCTTFKKVMGISPSQYLTS